MAKAAACLRRCSPLVSYYQQVLGCDAGGKQTFWGFLPSLAPGKKRAGLIVLQVASNYDLS